MLDLWHVRRDKFCQSTSCENGEVFWRHFRCASRHEFFNEADVAPYNAALHGSDGVTCQGVFRRDEFDARQSCRPAPLSRPCEVDKEPL